MSNVILKKPKRKDPSNFEGKPGEDFRVWIREVEIFVDYMEETWKDDHDKIQWVLGLLKGKAQVWYQQRVTTQAANNCTDT